MRAWFISLPVEARALVGATIALVCLALILAFFQIIEMLVASAGSVYRQQPLVSRLLGYEAAADQLEETARLAEAQTGTLIFSGGEDGLQSGAALQQVLREFAQDAGLVVSGSQLNVYALERPEDDEPSTDEFFVIAVSLAMEGPPLALDAFLESVRLHEPKLATTALDIQRPRQRRDRTGDNKYEPDQMMIRLNVTGLWGKTT